MLWSRRACGSLPSLSIEPWQLRYLRVGPPRLAGIRSAVASKRRKWITMRVPDVGRMWEHCSWRRGQSARRWRPGLAFAAPITRAILIGANAASSGCCAGSGEFHDHSVDGKTVAGLGLDG